METSEVTEPASPSGGGVSARGQAPAHPPVTVPPFPPWVNGTFLKGQGNQWRTRKTESWPSWRTCVWGHENVVKLFPLLEKYLVVSLGLLAVGGFPCVIEAQHCARGLRPSPRAAPRASGTRRGLRQHPSGSWVGPQGNVRFSVLLTTLGVKNHHLLKKLFYVIQLFFSF